MLQASETIQQRRWIACAERVLDGQMLRVYQWPNSPHQAPALALIHGLGEAWYIWEDVCQRLCAEFRLFSLDLPWYGREGHRWGHARSAVNWLHEALALMPTPPVGMMAHSFGANVVLEYLLRCSPQLGAVLLAPFYYHTYREFDWGFFERSMVAFHKIMEQAIRARKAADHTDPAVLTSMADKAFDQLGPLGFMEFFALVSRTPDLPLARVRAPSLIILGADDPGMTPAETRRLAHALPHSTLEIIPACGHFSMLEQPDAVARLVQRFFQAHLPLHDARSSYCDSPVGPSAREGEDTVWRTDNLGR